MISTLMISVCSQNPDINRGENKEQTVIQATERQSNLLKDTQLGTNKAPPRVCVDIENSTIA